MNFMRALVTVGGLTGLSRLVGFARDVATAAMLGAGPIADAFVIAFKLPNFFRRLFAEGAFSVSFVPLYAGKIESDGLEKARHFAEDALALMVAVLLPFTIVMMLLMPWVIIPLAPGVDDPARLAPAIEFSQITFPYLLMISLVALLGGVLNAHGRFAPFAAAPILFNLAMLGCLYLLTPHLPNAGYALSWGVFTAGVVQLLWLWWCCRRTGIVLRLRRPSLSPDVKKLLWLMLPGAIGAGVTQINLFVDVILASYLPAGSLAYLYYADRLNQLPLGVLGVAIGTALLPMLARHIKAGHQGAAGHVFSRAFEVAIFLGLPAAIGLSLAAVPIISVLFEREAFDTSAAVATAAALSAYALGLPAYVLNKVLATAFFARQDTKTPVIVAGVTVAVNTGLAIILLDNWQHVGIAFSTAVAAWVNIALLGYLLQRRGWWQLDAAARQKLPRLLLCNGLMALMIWFLMPLLQPLLAAGGVKSLLGLMGLIGGSGMVYLLACQITGATRAQDIITMLRRPADPISEHGTKE